MAGSSCIFCSSMRLTSISLLWFKRTNVRIKTNFHQEIGPTTTKYAFWLVSFVVSDRKLLILQQHNGIIKIASSSPQNYEILSNLFVWEARKLWRQILVAKMFISLMWINLLDGRSISDSHCEENRLAFRRLSAHVQHEKTRSARVLGAKRQSFEEKRRRKKKSKKSKRGCQEARRDREHICQVSFLLPVCVVTCNNLMWWERVEQFTSPKTSPWGASGRVWWDAHSPPGPSASPRKPQYEKQQK